MKHFRSLYLFPLLLLIGLAVLPLVLGSATLYHRDILGSHIPLKLAQAELLQEGRVPLVDPYRGGGQPLLGNPNALPLYPTNLLFLIADPIWAVNAHFWLHWLLAPFAMAWMARAWGLERRAAWAAAVCYATSGFFLAQLNLYNLVTGATLAPAFVAACLGLASRLARQGSSHRWGSGGILAVVGVLWALLILAGDPMSAVLAFAMGITAAVIRGADSSIVQPALDGEKPRLLRGIGRILGLLALPILLGTLVAAPMWIEFLRILPLSYRGYAEHSVRASLAQSWDPRTLLEWVVPLVFGGLDHSFWGQRFFGGNPPFQYSLYPGTLAWVLVFTSGRIRAARGSDLTRLWSWVWIALGIFFSLGFYNPIVRAMHGLPGMDGLRYPIKCWIVVAIAASLLCGFGFQRLLAGGRAAKTGFLVAAVSYGFLWLSLLFMPAPVDRAWRAFAKVLPEPMLATERLRLMGLVFFVLLTAFASFLVLLLCRRQMASKGVGRRPLLSLGVGAAGLLFLHAASQLFLLQPLIDTDEVGPYVDPPPALALVSPGARVADGEYAELFGELELIKTYPDPRFIWLLRERAASLNQATGIRFGLRYEMNRSPEGLGSFYSIALAQRMRFLDDISRIRVLAASGVDALFLHRPLEGVNPEEARLLGKMPTGEQTLYVYGLERSIGTYRWVDDLLPAAEMGQALSLLTDDGFDPRKAAVVPSDDLGEAGPAETPSLEETTSPSLASANSPGSPSMPFSVVSEDVEESVLDLSTPRAGLLVTDRAWLEIYLASVDGVPVEPIVTNLHKIGIPVPAGTHRVRIWVDRRPTRVAYGAALLALLALALLASGRLTWPWAPQ